MSSPTAGDVEAFLRAIGAGDRATAARMLAATPALATARLGQGAKPSRAVELFLADRLLQLYVGDSALHVAAASYDVPFARRLVAAGADVAARNRRGAQPLHAAVNGAPGSTVWDPRRQVAVIRFLIAAGADPDATAAGGVTPLHRAVRNRCAAAVRALLEAGADPDRANASGSTALHLAGQTTGRGGTGSPAAKAQQLEILRMLEPLASRR
jgi:hypothetical protein